jgi:uncharacterized membrane protein YphA (DoxX/SURF4 family)
VATILDTMFTRRVSVRVFGLSAAVLGVVGLVWGDYAYVWEPVPNGPPGLSFLGYAVAVPFLLAGFAIQWPRGAAAGTLALTVLYALPVIILDVPRAFAHPNAFLAWYGIAEPLALAAGALVAYACSGRLEPATAERMAKIGRLLFGACLIVFASAHFVYLDYTAKLVPAWLPPGKIFWAYATAGGHFAGGVAILSGIAARLAAMLLTAMFAVFAFLVHAPTIFTHPHVHFNWTENSVNFCLIASAWVIAASLPGGKPRG